MNWVGVFHRLSELEILILKSLTESLLRPRADVLTNAGLQQITSSQSSDKQDHSYDIAMTFKQPGNLNLPVVVGHDGELEIRLWKLRKAENVQDLTRKIGEQFLLPTLFGHLLGPEDQIGAQSFLLFGPPGTGKTLFVQSLAKIHKMTFFKVDNAALTSKFVGDTEKYDLLNSERLMLTDCRVIKALTEIAMASTPCIIFFDEIEGITRERQENESSFDRRFKNILLKMFNHLNETPSAIIVGATNRPWEIDEAFLNRFQQKVFFGLPRREDYMKMLINYLAGKRADVAEYQIDLLSTFMLNYSEREVAGALRELTTRMFTDLMSSSSFVPVSLASAARQTLVSDQGCRSR